jgi:hypothetical protein
MGLLDEAIREHLELKRLRGADPADVARMEREALGPARRPEIPAHAPQDPPAGAMDALGDERAPGAWEAGTGQQLDPFGSEAPAGTADFPPPRAAADADAPHAAPPLEPDDRSIAPHRYAQETAAFDVEAAVHEETLDYDEPPHPVDPHVDVPEPHAADLGADPLSGHVDEPALGSAEYEDAGVVEEPPLPPEPAPPEAFAPLPPADPAGQEPPGLVPPVPASPPAGHEPAGLTEPTQVYDVEVVHEPPAEPLEPPPAEPFEPAPAEPFEPAPGAQTAPPDVGQSPPPPSGPLGDPHEEGALVAGEAGEPGEHEEDVLEETPDFLQETPEHERLWFEQRPPRDFDFDK